MRTVILTGNNERGNREPLITHWLSSQHNIYLLLQSTEGTQIHKERPSKIHQTLFTVWWHEQEGSTQCVQAETTAQLIFRVLCKVGINSFNLTIVVSSVLHGSQLKKKNESEVLFQLSVGLLQVSELYWSDQHQSSKRYSLVWCFDDRSKEHCLTVRTSVHIWFTWFSYFHHSETTRDLCESIFGFFLLFLICLCVIFVSPLYQSAWVNAACVCRSLAVRLWVCIPLSDCGACCPGSHSLTGGTARSPNISCTWCWSRLKERHQI